MEKSIKNETWNIFMGARLLKESANKRAENPWKKSTV